MIPLIIKTSSLGDLIQTFPAADYLGEVDWVVEEKFAELLEAHPRVRRVLKVNTHAWRRGKDLKGFFSFYRTLRKEKYEVVFDLQGNCKSAIFTAMARAEHKVGFGRKSVHEWPNLLVTNCRFDPPPGENARSEYLHLVRAFYKDRTPFVERGVSLAAELLPIDLPAPVMLVCPGSAWKNKRLSDEALVEFCRLVRASHGYHFLWLWGNHEERELAKRLQRAFPDGSTVLPKLSVPQLQKLMSAVDIVFAVDSLPLHLCGTTKTPSFSVFGPSSALKYRPMGNQHRHLQGSCPYGQVFERRCPLLRSCGTGLCTRSLTGEELYLAFLGKEGAQPGRF
ncbi:MAG: hypothetical protein JSR80_08450 [Verrucomicrobia bacterium]|nr:hypothetical protein [Verrucomicrobiota bacterium]